MLFVVVTIVALCTIGDAQEYRSDGCAAPAQTLRGAVCGARRRSYGGAPYASFRGVPYARQPLGVLRFVAPQPLKSWAGFLNATTEGPVCPQHDVTYGPMMRPRSMGEDCLRINIHVPSPAMPEFGSKCSGCECLPVLVHVHGGGFMDGSGDSDVNGPEYMIDQNVVVVTFNYRLGPFGFLSLNSTSVPGNAGLRDMVAALRWVRDNARAFGGDPRSVTLMGQSAGGAAVHILSLSKAARGLFSKVIMMSGTAISGFCSTTAQYAEFVKSTFLKELGINSTDADEIHRTLIELPYETLLEANTNVRKSIGLGNFGIVVESEFNGVARIIDEDPDVSVANRRGSEYPLLIGFTNVECASLRNMFENNDVINKINENATSILPVKLLFSLSNEEKETATKQMFDRYFNGTPTLDQYIVSCSESAFIYHAIKLSEIRAATNTAPVFLYQFSYSSDVTALKQAFKLHYEGAGHLEDLSYVLRVNSILQNTRLNKNDEAVKDFMINAVGNFVRCSNPTRSACSGSWPLAARPLLYEDIDGAAYSAAPLTASQHGMMRLYDRLYGL